MLNEFKEFLTKSNALALAIGVIIGGAVGKVVGSLANDILMPLISLAIPGGEWRDWVIPLVREGDKVVKSLPIGSLLGSLIDFVIIAWVVFMITKWLLKPAPTPPAPPTKDCPECKESVLAAARKCKHCGSAV
jgi:large conductance mechanosensitive channel